MIQIKEIVNSIFASKTYILYKEEDRNTWIVDIGDIKPVIEFLSNERKIVDGVFLTHGHFDHIYGLQSLIEFCPTCRVFTTDFGKKSLASDKLNMSRYHGIPIIYSGDNVEVIHDKDHMILFDREPELRFFETPGHNPGCLTMVVGNYIFTGDAYIPGIGVNTQLPLANKEQAQESLNKIMKLAEGKKILSGHHI